MRITKRCNSVIAAFGFLAFHTVGTSQTGDHRPYDLIQFLTWQSEDRRGKPMTFTCGQVRAERTVARSLARFGSSALPDIEKALHTIDAADRDSKSAVGAGWILYAYATILGEAARPRLQAMSTTPRLAWLNFDYALALSMNLTSYVSNSRKPGAVLHCHRHAEPRDALDQLILGWITNDKELLVASLGPNARGALTLMLKGKTWSQMRTEIWGSTSMPHVAVGYRFQMSGAWAESDATLDSDRELGDAARLAEQPEFRIDTFFKDSTGKSCGRHHVKFVKAVTRTHDETLPYLIDNSDFSYLLHTIASCALRKR